MKIQTRLTLVLVLVFALLLPLTPARASSDEPCMHAEHTIQSLQDCVSHAIDKGHIDNQGVGKSLLAKLDAAMAAWGRGQHHAAVAQLEAFVHEVEAQSGKHIDSMHAEHMLMHAQMVIHSLSH